MTDYRRKAAEIRGLLLFPLWRFRRRRGMLRKTRKEADRQWKSRKSASFCTVT